MSSENEDGANAATAAGAHAPPCNLSLKPPDPVRLAGKNAPQAWKLWKQI